MAVGSDTPWRVRISEAATDREKGANEVALTAARAFLDGARESAPKNPLSKALAELVSGQRAMAPVLRLACDLALALEGNDPSRFKTEATRWVSELESAGSLFADNLVHDLPDLGRWVFFSYSSTVLTGIAALADQGMAGRAIVGEASPGSEGVRLAKRLVEAGWKVSLVPDTRLVDEVAQRGVDRIVLGCDACDADRFVNKTGSAGIAAAAKRRELPVEIWTTTHKILPFGGLNLLDLSSAQGSELKVARDDISVYQPLFGYGSMDDITFVRTERGIMTRAEVQKFVESLDPLAFDLLQPERKG